MRRHGFLAALALLIAAFLLAGRPVLAGAATEEADWPCDQRLVPRIALGTIWQGPPVDEFTDTWWENQEVFQLVGQLTDPTLTEEEVAAIIDGFAKAHENNKKDLLVMTFAGLFQKMNDERSGQIKKIKNFFRRMEKLTERISEISGKIREIRKAGATSEDPRLKELDEEMLWNTRVYDERERLAPYVCDEPILLEQRLGVISRVLQERLE